MGADTEGAVAGVLWDLYDPVAGGEAHDGAALGLQPIWDALVTRPRDICAFTASLPRAVDPQLAAEAIGSISNDVRDRLRGLDLRAPERVLFEQNPTMENLATPAAFVLAATRSALAAMTPPTGSAQRAPMSGRSTRPLAPG